MKPRWFRGKTTNGSRFGSSALAEPVAHILVLSCHGFGTIVDMAIDQPHRKQVRHFHEPGDFHELTFSCYRRMPLLTNADWRCRLSGCVDAALEEASFQLVAFVYMPEHIHLLVYPTLPEPDIGRYLA